MQKDTTTTTTPPSTMSLASNSGPSAGQQASGSGLHACPQAHKKPSISKVILKVMADKGARSRVSLATLKKALVTTGYNLARNDWRFKKVLKGLVEKGLLRQVTSKGAAGSFRMGKKHASASGFQRGATRRGRGRPRQRRQLGKPRQRQRRLLPGSKQGPRQLMKAARRAAKGPRT